MSDAEVAPIGLRVAAAIIDRLAVVVLMVGVGFVAGAAAMSSPEPSAGMFGMAALALVVVGFGWSVLNHIVFVALFGWSVGKLAVGLRVEDHVAGGPPRWWPAILRGIFPTLVSWVGAALVMVGVPGILIDPVGSVVVSSAPSTWWLVAAISVFVTDLTTPRLADLAMAATNEERRAAHDLVSGTVVIRA